MHLQFDHTMTTVVCTTILPSECSDAGHIERSTVATVPADATIHMHLPPESGEVGCKQGGHIRVISRLQASRQAL